MFCETCDRLTCRDCQLLKHKDHKYAELLSIFVLLEGDVDYVTKQNLNSTFKVMSDGEEKSGIDLSVEQMCFSISSYQFLEDAYRNHRQYLENMTHQLQGKRKGIEEMSSYISKG